MKSIIVFLLGIVLLGIWSCNRKRRMVEKADKDIYYTCSMHPQVVEDHPGNCPICHMPLIAMHKSQQKAGELQLSDEQVMLAHIKTDTLKTGAGNLSFQLPGVLSVDPTRTKAVSARVEGRIDRLYVKNIGDYVHKGDRLFDVYSEQLNSAKQEYLLALSQERELKGSLIDYRSVVRSAKDKLLLWGMTPGAIADLEKHKKIASLTTYYAPGSGYITDLLLAEGGYAMEGATVLKLADLSELWAEVQVYSSQLSGISLSDNARVTVVGMPGTSLKGRIDFISPEIDPSARIALVRVNVPNTHMQLHPGMQVNITISKKGATGIFLPADLVLRDGTMSMVWVKTGKNKFAGRMVTTGKEFDNRIEILSGLAAGDIIVSDGAYLLQSEAILRNGNTSSSMPGMDMKNGKM